MIGSSSKNTRKKLLQNLGTDCTFYSRLPWQINQPRQQVVESSHSLQSEILAVQ